LLRQSNGNLRAVDSAPIFKKDDTKDNDEKDKESRSERIATLPYQDGLKYCTDFGNVSKEQASELSSNEVEAQVDNCIEEVITKATDGDTTKRSTLEPSTDCAHLCGDVAAGTFEPCNSQCAGSLGSCKSCKKKDKKCSEYLINFKKGGDEEEEDKKGGEEEEKDKKGGEEEEKDKKGGEEEEKDKKGGEEEEKDKKGEEEGKEEDDDNEEEEERKRELYQKCLKEQEKEDEDYEDCVDEENDCEDYLRECEREQKKARDSLEGIPDAFDKW
jgi:hypothetical protein